MKHKIFKTNEYDNLMYDIESVAFVIMIICVLALFPIYKFFPAFLRVVFLVFGVSALFGFGIFIIFHIKEIIVFKDTVYQGMFEAQEAERKKKLEDAKSKSKK